MTASTTPKRTPLYDRHVALGAKVIDFGGWAMPVQYSSILDEHAQVRTRAGLFDVSHMGEVWFEGPGAAEAVQRIVTNDVGKLSDGRALYTVMCREHGGIVDDLIVYRVRSDKYLTVINAGNIAKDVAWFHQQADALCDVRDVSDETALFAVQGPRAIAILEAISSSPIAGLPSFGSLDGEVAGIPARVARTGYTGEDGVEIFVDAARAPELWDAILAAGEIKPIGLGARDTLRLEARLCLYGNDIDEEHTPLEAGLAWVVKGKGFVGEEALARQKAEGVKRRLVGFVMKERGTARHGYPIEGGGVVTSGSIGPTVGANIGMGYVPTALGEPGTSIVVDCRGKPARAEIVKGPFYRRPQ